MTAGLVAYWPLNGNAFDATTNHMDGQTNGVVPTVDRFGINLGAYAFSDETDIDFGSPVLLQFTTNDFSISTWVSFNGDAFIPRILSYGWSSGYEVIAYVEGDASRRFAFSGSGYWFQTTNTYPPGSWHSVIAVKTASEVRLYVNGVLDGRGAGAFAPTYEGTFQIGNNPMDSSSAWGGEIDEVRIYNRALAESEIKSLAGLLNIERDGAKLVLNWLYGILVSADELEGPWTPVPGASPPWTVTPTEGKKFYRLQY
jgi:hypothetical protein